MVDDSKPKSGTREWGAGRVAFLAKLEVVCAERAAGRSLAAIFRTHFEGVISEKQFRRYVERYVARGNAPEAVLAVSQAAASAPSAVRPAGGPSPAVSDEPSGRASDDGGVASAPAGRLDLDAIRSKEWDLDGLARLYRQQKRNPNGGKQ